MADGVTVRVQKEINQQGVTWFSITTSPYSQQRATVASGDIVWVIWEHLMMPRR